MHIFCYVVVLQYIMFPSKIMYNAQADSQQMWQNTKCYQYFILFLQIFSLVVDLQLNLLLGCINLHPIYSTPI